MSPPDPLGIFLPGDMVQFWLQGNDHSNDFYDLDRQLPSSIQKLKDANDDSDASFSHNESLGLVIKSQGPWVWASWNFLDGAVIKCLHSELVLLQGLPNTLDKSCDEEID